MKYALLVSLLALNGIAQAQDSDWLVRVGAHQVKPKGDNHDLVEVESDTQLTFSATYRLTPNLGLELLGALPFRHEIRLKDGTQVGETKHLPPTLSLQYHFLPEASLRPYAGLGLNYTLFFDEETTGPLSGSELKLDNSLGLAAVVGLDMSITDQLSLNLDLRWFDIDTAAELDGNELDTVEIDPLGLGLSLGYRF